MLKLCLSFQRISYFVQIDSFSWTFSFLTYLYALSDLFGKAILDMHCNILSLQAYCSSPKFPYRKKSKTQDPSSADNEVQRRILETHQSTIPGVGAVPTGVARHSTGLTVHSQNKELSSLLNLN